LVMGVVWVRNPKASETGDMSAIAADWREASRRNVDAVIERIRRAERARVAFKETACPECSYITRNVFFPAQCTYCGGSLQPL